MDDFRELSEWITKKKKFSTYDLLSKRTFTRVQLFSHPFSPGEKIKREAVSICLPGNICSTWEIFLYDDGTWELN